MKNNRGFTLLEVLIALAILVVGGLGTLQMIDILSKSTGNVSAEAEALSIARQLRSEMEQVQLLQANLANAEWAPGPHTVPEGGLTTVGPIDDGAQQGRYLAQYVVAPWTDAGGVVRGLDITIVVDNQAIRTDVTNSTSRLLRPVVLSVRKEVQTSVAGLSGGGVRW